MTETAGDTAKEAGEAMEGMAKDASDTMKEAASTAGEAMEGEKKTHTVARGDTLWEIARTHYGDPAKWRAIAEANPQINPNRIDVGMELNLPSAN